MRDIPLNEETIELLNETMWFVQDENYKVVRLSCPKSAGVEAAEHFTSLDYLEKIKRMGGEHDGFPEAIVGHSFASNGMEFAPTGNIQLADECGRRVLDFYQKIQTHFNLRRNALFSVYPPEHGYISWHNNANASAYNFIFTYSETGEGWWKHYDPIKQEIVTIPDVKGWQCKAGYFGSYSDGLDRVVYHAARNYGSGLRMTIAFTLDKSETALGLQDWIIEDIREE